MSGTNMMNKQFSVVIAFFCVMLQLLRTVEIKINRQSGFKRYENFTGRPKRRSTLLALSDCTCDNKVRFSKDGPLTGF